MLAMLLLLLLSTCCNWAMRKSAVAVFNLLATSTLGSQSSLISVVVRCRVPICSREAVTMLNTMVINSPKMLARRVNFLKLSKFTVCFQGVFAIQN
jgi:predicted cation transporter